MAYDAGSLQASLSLNIRAFAASINNAAQLARGLGQQLNDALGNTQGFSVMLRQLAQIQSEVERVRGSIQTLKASLGSISGADLSASVKQFTANLSPRQLFAQWQETFGRLENSLSRFGERFQESFRGLSGLNLPVGFEEAANSLATLTNNLTGTYDKLRMLVELAYALGDAFDISVIGAERLSAMLSLVATKFGDVASKLNSGVTAFERASTASAKTEQAAKGTGPAIKKAATESSKFGANITKAAKSLQTAKGYAISIQGIIGGIVISQAFYRLLNIMGELVRGSMEFMNNMAQSQIAFKYLLGSAEEASTFLTSLQDIAIESPLSTTAATSMARKLMAMGFSAKATIPALRILTDTAAVFTSEAGGMSDMMDHIVLALGQMQASGTVSSQELRQLYNAGLPVYQLLADSLGMTLDQVKNIGKYGVDSTTAVFGILTQLQKKYAGASEEMTQTLTGAFEVIKDGIYVVANIALEGPFNKVTAFFVNLSKKVEAIVEIARHYGAGGVFQALFPRSSQTQIRAIMGMFGQLGSALKTVASIVTSVFSEAWAMIRQALALIGPPIMTVVNAIVKLIAGAIEAIPALKTLLAILTAFGICAVISKLITAVARALGILKVFAIVGEALKGIVMGLVGIWKTGSKTLVILALLTALLSVLVLSSERAKAAIGAFVDSAILKLNNFSNALGIGFDVDKLALPKFEDSTTKYNDSMQALIDSYQGVAEAAEKADEAQQNATGKNQSFDEVYNVDSGTAGSNSTNNMADILDQLGQLQDITSTTDWTGDFWKDWAAVSDGLDFSGITNSFKKFAPALGDLGSGLLDDLRTMGPDIGAALLESFQNTNLDSAAVGSALGAALGAVFGGGLGAKLGAIAGAIAGWFWEDFVKAVGMSDGVAIALPIGTVIGTGIGFLIGGPAGAAVGAAIGALVGWITGLFIDGFSTGNWDAMGLSISLGTALGAAIGMICFGPVGAAVGAAIGALVGWITGLIIENWGAISDWFYQAWLDTGDFFNMIGKAIADGWWAIGDWFNAIFKGIGDFFNGIGNAVVTFFTVTIPGAFNSLWTMICDIGKSIADFFLVTIPNAWNSLWTALTSIDIGKIFYDIGYKIGYGIGQIVKTIWEFITVTIPNFFAAIGIAVWNFITVTLPNFFKELGKTIWNFITVTFPNFVKETIKKIGDFFAAIGKAVWNFISVTVPNFFAAIGKALWDFITITFPNFVKEVIRKIGDFFNTVAVHLKDFITKTIPKFFTDLWNKIWTFITVDLPAKIAGIWAKIKEIGGNIIKGIIEGIKAAFTGIKDAVSGFFNGLIQGFKDAFGIASPAKETNFIGQYIIEGILKGFDMVSGLWDKVKEVGGNIINGVCEGIKGAYNTVKDAVGQAADWVVNGFKSLFGIASPAKEMMPIGAYITAGLAKGIGGNVPALTQSIKAVNNEVANGLGAVDTSIAAVGIQGDLSPWIDSSIGAIKSWSIQILELIDDTVTNALSRLADLWAGMTPNYSFGNINGVVQTERIITNMSGANALTTGTQTVGAQYSVTVMLTEEQMNRLADTIGSTMFTYLAPLMTKNSEGSDQPPVWIGTLIADERGLIELERKLKVIRVREERR